MTTFLIKMKPKRKHFSRAGEPLKIFALKQSNLISSFWRERRKKKESKCEIAELRNVKAFTRLFDYNWTWASSLLPVPSFS